MPTPDTHMNLYAKTVDRIARSHPDEVFFLSVEAYPEPGSLAFGSTGGAYAHCYLDADDLAAAELRMLALLREAGWRPHRLEGWEIVSLNGAKQLPADDQEFNPLDLVLQTLREGHALVFYTWDIDAPNACDAPDSTAPARIEQTRSP